MSRKRWGWGLAWCRASRGWWTVVFAASVLGPAGSSALTGGPTEPAAQAPSAIRAEGLVDPFTGDFQYSIPLFELPGPHESYHFPSTIARGFKLCVPHKRRLSKRPEHIDEGENVDTDGSRRTIMVVDTSCDVFFVTSDVAHLQLARRWKKSRRATGLVDPERDHGKVRGSTVS